MTISPEKSQEFHRIITEKKGEWVESPVLGNQLVAEAGKLQVSHNLYDFGLTRKVCVGATREQFDKLSPMLSCLGTPRYVGEVGKATTMKLGMVFDFPHSRRQGLNYILGANVVAFSNAFGLMEQAGVDLDMFTTVLSNGPLNLAGGYYP